MDAEEVESPVERLAGMFLVNMIKRSTPAMRVRADAPHVDEWVDGAFAPSHEVPQKLRIPLIDHLKKMADLPSDLRLHYNATIRLVLGLQGPKHDFDVTYAQSDGGGVIVVKTVPAVSEEGTSDRNLVQRASAALEHAHEGATREEVRATVRDAVALVPEGPARCSLLRRGASRCLESGLYEDALAYLRLALPAAADPRDRASIHARIAQIHGDMNRGAEAFEPMSRALGIAEEFPEPNIQVAFLLQLLGDIHIDRAEVDAAERATARAESIFERILGDTAARVILCRTHVQILRARGDAAAAETLAKQSLDDAERFALVLEAESLREELADLALARGDAKSAVMHLRAVLQRPNRSPLRARAYNALARALHALGNDAEALSALRAASVLADGALPADHPIRIETERELATLAATSPYR